MGLGFRAGLMVWDSRFRASRLGWEVRGLRFRIWFRALTPGSRFQSVRFRAFSRVEGLKFMA